MPAAKASHLRRAALLSVAGALAAGCFGILHNQITYTISPEYFTRMKFDQFHGADFGWPRRVFVAEIGFLATWWVGVIAAWFLARVALPKLTSPAKAVMKALAIVTGVAALGGIVGYFAGPWLFDNRAGWQDTLSSFGVMDSKAFNRVAGIHLGSYAGALAGWIATMVAFIRRKPETHPKRG